MGLSQKEFSIRDDSKLRSVSGKLLSAVFSFGLGSILARDAVAAEVTNIKQAVAKLCIGSDAGGFISGQKLGWEGVLTDGKLTGFSTTDGQVFNDKMFNPYESHDYLAGTHRNFAYTRWPADNDIIEGYYLYDVKDPNNVKKSLVINKSNYPGYKEKTRVHFVKGATSDQDQMVFLNYDVVEVYKSPFDANGKVKPECKVGPVLPHFTHKLNFSAYIIRAIEENVIVLDDSEINPVIHRLKIGIDTIVEDKTVILKGIKASGLKPIQSGFITLKNSNGSIVTYFSFQSGGKMTLVDVDNPDIYKDVDALHIAAEDPDGRYMFKFINEGSGKYAVYVTDLWAAKPVNVKVLDDAINGIMLQGLLAYAPGFKGAAWVLYGEDQKARLIELEDPVTMKVKVTGVPFTTFKDKFDGGGQACVTLPNQVPVITKTGTVDPEPKPEPPPEAAPEAVEPSLDADAGSTEVDGGGAEVVTPPPDAIDAWLNGEIADMQDIFKEAGGDDAAPDVLVPPPDGTPDTLDQTDASEVSGSDVDAAIDAWLDGKGDMQDIFNGEVDGVVTAPDMSTNDGAVKSEVEPDTAAPKDNGTPAATDNGAGSLDAGRNPSVDGGSGDGGKNTPPVVKPPVKPSQPDCNAGPDGNPNSAFPFALAALTLTFTRVRRRVEAVMKWLAEK